MNGLALNCFPVELSPSTVTLPYLECSNWEATSAAKDEQPPGTSTWRYQPDSNLEPVRLVLLSSSTVPEGAATDSFDLGRFWKIATILIENALATRLAQHGLSIESDHFSRTALRPESMTASDPMIELATGITFEARHPFKDEPYRFILSIQWTVRAMFKQSLAHEPLRLLAPGMPVIFRPAKQQFDHSLLPYKNRFLGRVRAADSPSGIEVACRDGSTRTISPGDLWLEASPAVLKQYERSKVSQKGASQIVRRIQQLNRTLTNENRRNVSVLKDRMDAIRTFLRSCAMGSREEIILPFPGVESGTITIGLSPIEVAIGGLW